LDNINVRMRSQILSRLAEISKFQNAYIQRDIQDLMATIINSIENDISSLEERPVVELMHTLNKIMSVDSSKP
jgi:Mg2+ and Co2+ transporter CorA